ncbi:MAG: hypothetical protein HYY93_14620 [Planctomycetes bacterium]|nr:hypothetical protein [Planctomycetota bacterium]
MTGTEEQESTESGAKRPMAEGSQGFRARAEPFLEIDESGPCVVRSPRGQKRRMAITLEVTMLLFVVPAAWFGYPFLAAGAAAVPVLLYLSTFSGVMRVEIDDAGRFLTVTRSSLFGRRVTVRVSWSEVREVGVRPAEEVSLDHTYMRPFSVVLSIFALHVLFPSMRVPVEVWDVTIRTAEGERVLITSYDRGTAERARDLLARRIGGGAA